MKALNQFRLAALRVAIAAFVLLATVCAFVSAASLPSAVGHTGQALALRSVLHPAKHFLDAGFLKRAVWPHSDDGRYIANGRLSEFGARPRPMAAGQNAAPIIIDEGVQTFDVFAPPPAFTTTLTSNGQLITPSGLAPVNLTPTWSPDEKYLIFSSNRDANGNVAFDGHFHLWAVLAKGGAVVQVTTGSGNEFWPTLDTTSNNPILAFTSDANSPGNQQLYVIGGNNTGVPFQVGQTPIDPASLVNNTASAKTLGDTDFANVQHPTLSPGSDRIAFSAVTQSTSVGHTANASHIYYLYLSNNGYNPQPSPGQPNPPAQLTDGPANDTDPAWSPDGRFIAYSSTAAGFTNNTSSTAGIGPGLTPTLSTGNSKTQRGIFLILGNNAALPFGTVPPALVGAGGRVTVGGSDSYGPAWSFNTSNRYFNPNGTLEYLAFARGSAINSNHGIYYFRLLNDQTGAVQTDGTNANDPITPESYGGKNDSVMLNTSDPDNAFDDVYPTWAPFQSIFSIAYESGSLQQGSIVGGRSITYNTPGTNIPTETPTNLPDGTNNVSTIYTGILESQVLNLDPPTLVRFSGSEVIRVTDAKGNPTRNLQPSSPGASPSQANIIVRLSDREAGIDDNKVFLQIKDPDSKYQDSQGLEHKVFANCNDVEDNPNGDSNVVPLGSGTSRRLFNGGNLTEQYNVSNVLIGIDGAIGGWDTTANSPLAVGHGNNFTGGLDSSGKPTGSRQGSDFTLASYRPWGQEYECQYLNPTVANPGTNPGDYGVPYYLAGVDDITAFSGDVDLPRPTTNDATRPDFRDRYAQWLQLNRLPDAQQDGQGGVLYGVTYDLPIAASDFYLDTIAYDKASFPAIEAFPDNPPAGQDFHQRNINWRIYDNVGGFTTQTFDGSNDILVVVDNALGQKFSFTAFGQTGGSNLIPALYGSESYYTDVDVNLLPNAVDFGYGTSAPTPPSVPGPTTFSYVTSLTATPGSGFVTLTWAGVTPAPTQYNVYRSTTSPVPHGTGVTPIGTVAGTAQTTYTDNAVTNGQHYYYVVTVVNGTNEGQPQVTAETTPQNFTGPIQTYQQLSFTGIPNGASAEASTYFNVQNGLGVNSYSDGTIDDGGRVDAPTTGATQTSSGIGANLPNGQARVPYVRTQKYSIWRILSRGPIPSTVLAGYQPNFQSQPAVADTVNGVTAPAEAAVPVANRCVIWDSPYTGELPLVDAGSLENQTTQSELQGFVNAGGRLCLTGANVAAALSLQNPNSSSTLLATLGAQYASTTGGNQTLKGAGSRISGVAGGPNDANPKLIDGTYFFPYSTGVTPNQYNLFLGNNYAEFSSQWRTDGALDQLGPNVSSFGRGNSVAHINTITPLAGTTLDLTTNGAAGLIYHESYATDGAGNPAAGYGSRVVFGSFGLEGIGQEYYRFTINSNPFFGVANVRSHILHNIVNYLRTGALTGRVTQASGQGISGATVYVRPNGAIPGPRQLFSTISNFDGSYTISGLEPGFYSITAYKQGFTTSSSNVSFGVEGDTTANATGLVISPVPPGAIAGTVTDTSTKLPVKGVTVTFISADKQTTLTAVTGADGTYSIENVPIGAYNGTASKTPQYTDAAAPTQGNPITVTSGAAAPADFTLTPVPASVSGIVFNDLNGDGVYTKGTDALVAGATVTFTPQTKGVATPPSVTSAADGTYTITGLAPGTYTVTATSAGLQSVGTRTVTVQPGDTLTGKDIPLIAVPPTPPGYLGGLITDAYTGQPLAGVTITVTDANGKQVAQVISTGTTAKAASPQGDGQPVNYGPVSLPPGQYSVTATLAGFGTQSLANLTVVSNAFTRADFSSSNGNPLQPIHVFPAGYNFFSVPYDYAAAGVSIDNLFGTLNTGTRANPSAGSNRSHVFVWSPVLLQYVLDPTPPADGLHLGQGYWIYLTNPVEVTKTGNPTTTTTIPVGLHLGWNQIGVPSLSAVSASRLAFANPAGGGSISFTQAISSSYHLVSPTLYGYNGTSYVSLTTGGTLQPWQSYWIYAFADTTILLPTGGG